MCSAFVSESRGCSSTLDLSLKVLMANTATRTSVDIHRATSILPLKLMIRYRLRASIEPFEILPGHSLSICPCSTYSAAARSPKGGGAWPTVCDCRRQIGRLPTATSGACSERSSRRSLRSVRSFANNPCEGDSKDCHCKFPREPSATTSNLSSRKPQHQMIESNPVFLDWMLGSLARKGE